MCNLMLHFITLLLVQFEIGSKYNSVVAMTSDSVTEIEGTSSDKANQLSFLMNSALKNTYENQQMKTKDKIRQNSGQYKNENFKNSLTYNKVTNPYTSVDHNQNLPDRTFTNINVEGNRYRRSSLEPSLVNGNILLQYICNNNYLKCQQMLPSSIRQPKLMQNQQIDR